MNTDNMSAYGRVQNELLSLRKPTVVEMSGDNGDRQHISFPGTQTVTTYEGI
jgi:hypothetical protein